MTISIIGITTRVLLVTLRNSNHQIALTSQIKMKTTCLHIKETKTTGIHHLINMMINTIEDPTNSTHQPSRLHHNNNLLIESHQESSSSVIQTSNKEAAVREERTIEAAMNSVLVTNLIALLTGLKTTTRRLLHSTPLKHTSLRQVETSQELKRYKNSISLLLRETIEMKGDHHKVDLVLVDNHPTLVNQITIAIKDIMRRQISI